MFLSQILNKKKITNKASLSSILKLKLYTKNLQNYIYLLKKLKNKKKFKSLRLILLKNFSLPCNKHLVTYIINIQVSITNTLVNITDIKGKLKFFRSSGSIKLKGKHKIKQPAAFINILKVLITEAQFIKNNPVAIHFKNLSTYYELYLIKILKKKIFIKIIKSYNLQPHNGCRPKKIKRLRKKIKKY